MYATYVNETTHYREVHDLKDTFTVFLGELYTGFGFDTKKVVVSPGFSLLSILQEVTKCNKCGTLNGYFHFFPNTNETYCNDCLMYLEEQMYFQK